MFVRADSVARPESAPQPPKESHLELARRFAALSGVEATEAAGLETGDCAVLSGKGDQ